MDAVIDIGSNSVRLMLNEKKSVNAKVLNTTQLSEGLAILNRLDEKAMVRTANAVADFFHAAKKAGADRVFVFGTEAMRCPGGETLKKTIESTIPVNVDIISGEKEAICGYIGATGGMGKNAVIDIGGASVELTLGNDDKILYAESLKIGVVRTRDAVGCNKSDIEKYYADKIGGFKKISADRLIGIGGTATSLASMALCQKVYDAESIHGSVITRDRLGELTERIFSSDDITREFPTIGEKRAGVIGHGAILLGLAMDYLGFKEISVSEHDNIEGYLALQNLTASR